MDQSEVGAGSSVEEEKDYGLAEAGVAPLWGGPWGRRAQGRFSRSAPTRSRGWVE